MDGLQNNYLYQWIAFYLLLKSLQSTHAFSLLFCIVYKSYNINLLNTFLSSSPKSCILAQFSWVPSWTATVSRLHMLANILLLNKKTMHYLLLKPV